MGGIISHLKRMTEHRNKQGDMSSTLAWGDLAGMELDAGNVVEYRSTEVTCLRGKRVYDTLPWYQALRNKCNMIKTRWVYSN